MIDAGMAWSLREICALYVPIKQPLSNALLMQDYS